MEIYLIRHAQSQNNALPEEQRVADPGLTARGAEQAQHLAQWIPSLNLTRLISSPFRRALETTWKLREATGLTAEVRSELHEQGGCYSGHLPHARVGQPGLTRREIEEHFPGFAVAADIDGVGWWRCRPYESREQAKARAGVLLERARGEFARTKHRVALVMHADLMLLMLEHFHTQWLDIPRNASVAKVVMVPDQTRLVEFNRVEHLPRHLITS